jgi:cell wall-associated NlpC family hydrolase
MIRFPGNILFFFGSCFILSCQWTIPTNDDGIVNTLSITDTLQAKDTVINMADTSIIDNTQLPNAPEIAPSHIVNTGNTHPAELLSFAKTLIGVPYLWGSTNPAKGFDCSGFITYVFNNFGIAVPRSSVDFTDVGQHVPEEQAKPGDLVLFTGTNPMETHVGHMGIVVENNKGKINFIHSTSGKAYGVTITELGDYYKTRYVKTIRIFPQNN